MLTPEIEPTGNFSAVPGNLGSFMSSIQSQAPVEEPAVDFDPDGESDQDEQPGEAPINWGGEEEPARKAVPTNVGRGFARFTDRGLAFAMGLYAHNPSDKYRATEQEFHEIEEAFVDFINETGIDISPALNLIIALSAIYVFKFGDVHRDRQENLKRERAEIAAERQRRALESDADETVELL